MGGFHNIGNNVGWFVLVILTCVFTLPILWLTALPFGDVSVYSMKTNVVDEDIAIRLWKICRTPSERAAAGARLKVVTRQAAVRMVKVLPFLKPVVCKLDPALIRVLSNRPAV